MRAPASLFQQGCRCWYVVAMFLMALIAVVVAALRTLTNPTLKERHWAGANSMESAMTVFLRQHRRAGRRRCPNQGV